MSSTITGSEFLPLLEKARDDLSDCSIGFVKFRQDASPVDAVLAGSGTLVSAHGVRGILTAEHVISNLPNTGLVGLIALSRFGLQLHRVTLDMERVQKIAIARGPEDSRGPDLGLLVLSATDAKNLGTGKFFYNLLKRSERLLVEPPPADKGAWVLCGMAEEWTEDRPPPKGYARVKCFRGLCGAGDLAGERVEGGFDYISFEVKYGEDYIGPQSYKGFSGGGLWQILLEDRDDGSVEISELILSGVAFYESPLAEERRIIECHGRRSIYEGVVRALEGAAS